VLRRLKLLLLCLGLGVFAALLGQALVASPWWWLCVPAAVAGGWLLVADPTRCEEPPR